MDNLELNLPSIILKEKVFELLNIFKRRDGAGFSNHV